MKKIFLILAVSIICWNCKEKDSHEPMAMDATEMETMAMGHKACSIKNFMAELNTKEKPNRLSVMGNIMVHSEKAEIVFKKADPQGMNDTILLMELTVKENGSRKDMEKHIHYEDTGTNAGKYKQVQVKGHDNCTAKVEIKG